MSELKSALNTRQTLEENAIYKEFDRATGTFKEISKQERDAKSQQLESQLQELKEKERLEKLEMDNMHRRNMGASMKMGDLFSELRLKASNNSN